VRKQSEYSQAGVNYAQLEPFKTAMQEIGRQTLHLPERRGVRVVADALHAHGAVYYYDGSERVIWVQTQEGLGNKNWIAEWLYEHAGTGRTYYEAIGIDNALMAVNDVLAQGALPVIYTDEVAASHSDWFADEKRARDLAAGFLQVCQLVGMALPAGESPALRYIINPQPPVKQCASLSGCVVGIVNPADRLITGHKLSVGDSILGVTSSGVHANGISLVIKRGLSLPDQFLTKLPTGRTYGEEALIPTRSYVALIEAWQQAQVDIHAILPGTGSGVAKLAYDKRPFTYRIHTWVTLPPLCQFLQEQGLGLNDLLTTFNCGIGYYVFVPPQEVERSILLGEKAGYEVVEVGRVETGERKVIFEPAGLELPPPGEHLAAS